MVLTEKGKEEDENHVPIISKSYLGEMRKWYINKANDSYISFYQTF